MQEATVQKVKRFCEEQELFSPEDRVLLGLSGGSDSVGLFFLLLKLRGQLFSSFSAYHVNHGLRGDAADHDETFCRELCSRFSVPFFSVSADIRAYAAEHRMGLEEAGREVRYAEAERLLKEQGLQKLALAHQQNDVAETFLFQLFRGSSLSGLSSIPVKRGNIVRPVLCLQKNEIEEYLRKLGEPFCTDATNAETDYTRNKVRNCILPYAEENINERSTEHVAMAALKLSTYRDYFRQQAEHILSETEKMPNGFSVPISLLLSEPEVMREEVLYRLLCRTAGSAKDITGEHVRAVEGLLTKQSGKRISLPYSMTARRSFQRLLLEKISAEPKKEPSENPELLQISVPGCVEIPETGISLAFSILKNKKVSEIPKNEYTKWFDYDKIRGTLRLRKRKAGDRIGLLSGSKSLKTVFQEKKIAVSDREALWLLSDEEQVLLVPFVRSCDNYRVDDTTETILEVKINGGETDGNECPGIDFRGGSKKKSNRNGQTDH